MANEDIDVRSEYWIYVYHYHSIHHTLWYSSVSCVAIGHWPHMIQRSSKVYGSNSNIHIFSIHYVHQCPLSLTAVSKVNKCSYLTIIISQTSYKPYIFSTKVYIFCLKVMTIDPKNWKYFNMLRISPLTVLAPFWLLSGMKNPFTVGKLQNTSCTGLKIIFYCPNKGN